MCVERASSPAVHRSASPAAATSTNFVMALATCWAGAAGRVLCALPQLAASGTVPAPCALLSPCVSLIFCKIFFWIFIWQLSRPAKCMLAAAVQVVRVPWSSGRRGSQPTCLLSRSTMMGAASAQLLNQDLPQRRSSSAALGSISVTGITWMMTMSLSLKHRQLPVAAAAGAAETRLLTFNKAPSLPWNAAHLYRNK